MSAETPEDISSTIVGLLDGSLGLKLSDMHWMAAEMDGLPEFYVRDAAGTIFRFTCEAVGDDDFDPFSI